MNFVLLFICYFVHYFVFRSDRCSVYLWRHRRKQPMVELSVDGNKALTNQLANISDIFVNSFIIVTFWLLPTEYGSQRVKVMSCWCKWWMTIPLCFSGLLCCWCLWGPSHGLRHPWKLKHKSVHFRCSGLKILIVSWKHCLLQSHRCQQWHLA